MTATDADILERARSPMYWAGALYDFNYDLAERALALAPDDPLIVARVLTVLATAAMPGAPLASRRASLERAVREAERLLPSQPDSASARVMRYWVLHLRALEALLERPTPEQLVAAGAKLDEAWELTQRPRLANEQEQYNDRTRTMILARRRAWELLFAGERRPEELAERLRSYVADYEYALTWPIAPLTRDEGFRAQLKQVLGERTRAHAHPAASFRGGLFVSVLATEGQPNEEELEGRWLVSLWLNGIDQAAFLRLGDKAIELHPASLRFILGLGFDVDALDLDGETLLMSAVRQDRLEAVRLLIAAGADPELKARKGKRQSARQLAVGRKRKAIISALEGRQTPVAAHLAEALRAAARGLDRRSLRFLAGLYGREDVDPPALIEAVLARAPESPEQVLESISGDFVFDRYVVARVLREAGHARDVKLRGTTVLEAPLTVSGNLVIEGALVDDLADAPVAVAGDLRAHALVTEADVLVGGDLDVRDFIWGDSSDGALTVQGDVSTPLLVTTDHTCEAAGDEQAAVRLVDPKAAALASHFVPAVLVQGALDRAVLISRLRRKLPVLVPRKPGATPSADVRAPARRARGRRSARSAGR